eukprot:TRINITY_DN31586_c0_g1_i1.p1 TRINITY_DN31586_c0_g1~~TRINITY_DN31586_c0_g1_i1.p1  ORF type:complete len:1550 (-),score=326.55 TRINITY_DN31586_c0_g1_i1:221-4870(-)
MEALRQSRIQVAVRLRPLLLPKEARGRPGKSVVSMARCSTTVQADCIPGGLESYACDLTYSSLDPRAPNYASQEVIYADLGHALVSGSLEGLDMCLFAFGATGSGKSYSTLGSADSPGLIPRLVDHIFQEKTQLEAEGHGELRVWISYLEICNERLRDLLSVENDQPDPQVMEHPQLGVQVCCDVPCETLQDVQRLMDFGTKKRVVSATQVFGASSRSHSAFVIQLLRTDNGLSEPPRPKASERGDAKVWRSKLMVLDLAGSERLPPHLGALTGAHRASYRGCSTNLGLAALIDVVRDLAEDMKPSFRRSQLTRLMKPCLSGDCKTFMLATLSPSLMDVEDTLVTLRFMSSVRALKTEASPNRQSTKELCEALARDISRMRAQVEGSGTLPSKARRLLEERVHHQEILHAVYSKPYQAQLEEARAMDVVRTRALQDLTLSQESRVPRSGRNSVPLSAREGDSEEPSSEKPLPYLLNMSDDATLAGCLMYYIFPGRLTTIGAAEDNVVRVNGVGIVSHLCAIENRDNSSLLIWKCSSAGRVVSGGQRLQEGQQSDLRHGGRIFLGRSLALKVFIPSSEEAAAESTSSEVSDLMLTAEFEDEWCAVKDAQAWLNLSEYLQQVSAQIDGKHARALQDDVKEAVKVCDEANELSAELRPHDGLHFEVDLTSAVPATVVIRVLRLLGQNGEGLNQYMPLYLWTVLQARERLDRMREAFQDCQREGAAPTNPLFDPWHEVHPADCMCQLLELKARLEDKDYERYVSAPPAVEKAPPASERARPTGQQLQHKGSSSRLPGLRNYSERLSHLKRYAFHGWRLACPAQRREEVSAARAKAAASRTPQQVVPRAKRAPEERRPLADRIVRASAAGSRDRRGSHPEVPLSARHHGGVVAPPAPVSGQRQGAAAARATARASATQRRQAAPGSCASTPPVAVPTVQEEGEGSEEVEGIGLGDHHCMEVTVSVPVVKEPNYNFDASNSATTSGTASPALRTTPGAQLRAAPPHLQTHGGVSLNGFEAGSGFASSETLATTAGQPVEEMLPTGGDRSPAAEASRDVTILPEEVEALEAEASARRRDESPLKLVPERSGGASGQALAAQEPAPAIAESGPRVGSDGLQAQLEEAWQLCGMLQNQLNEYRTGHSLSAVPLKSEAAAQAGVVQRSLSSTASPQPSPQPDWRTGPNRATSAPGSGHFFPPRTAGGLETSTWLRASGSATDILSPPLTQRSGGILRTTQVSEPHQHLVTTSRRSVQASPRICRSPQQRLSPPMSMVASPRVGSPSPHRVASPSPERVYSAPGSRYISPRASHPMPPQAVVPSPPPVLVTVGSSRSQAALAAAGRHFVTLKSRQVSPVVARADAASPLPPASALSTARGPTPTAAVVGSSMPPMLQYAPTLLAASAMAASIPAEPVASPQRMPSTASLQQVRSPSASSLTVLAPTSTSHHQWPPQASAAAAVSSRPLPSYAYGAMIPAAQAAAAKTNMLPSAVLLQAEASSSKTVVQATRMSSAALPQAEVIAARSVVHERMRSSAPSHAEGNASRSVVQPHIAVAGEK